MTLSKSKRPVIAFKDLSLLFEIEFPVTIEGSVNGKSFKFIKGEKSKLQYNEYEAISHSSYAKYLGN